MSSIPRFGPPVEVFDSYWGTISPMCTLRLSKSQKSLWGKEGGFEESGNWVNVHRKGKGWVLTLGSDFQINLELDEEEQVFRGFFFQDAITIHRLEGSNEYQVLRSALPLKRKRTQDHDELYVETNES